MAIQDDNEDFLPLSTVVVADGSFTIDGIPAGEYDVVARKRGLGNGTATTIVATGSLTEDVNLELSVIALGSISGKVTYEDNTTPIQDAVVSFFHEGTLYDVFTDEFGEYIIEDAPEGTHNVTASKVRHSTESKEVVVVEDGQLGDIDFILEKYFDEGEGFAESPFIIYDADQLNNVRYYPNDPGVHFLVDADIDLTDYLAEDGPGYNEGAGWEPIGTEEQPFMGTFDGNNTDYTISGLFIDDDTMDDVGLFGFTREAVLKDVRLTGADIIGNGCVGGLVGYNEGGTIDNCYTAGYVLGNKLIGGLVGYNYEGEILNSHAEGGVAGIGDSSENIGGLVGILVGSCEGIGTIDSCTASGAVEGYTSVGGLVGYNDEGSITESYATGDVSGDMEIGGLVGYNNGEITASYATGNVNGTGEENFYIGGLVGNYYGGTVDTASYYNSETTGQNDEGKGIPKTTAEMKDEQTFTGWDFETIWTLDEGRTYPYLRWQTKNFDFAPPLFAVGYPQLLNPFFDSLDLAVQVDEAGVAYYVVLPRTDNDPDLDPVTLTAEQVKAGADDNDVPVEISGIIILEEGAGIETITGLTDGTLYDVYVVAEDAVGNLQPDALVERVTGSTTELNTDNSSVSPTTTPESPVVNKIYL